MSTAALSDVLGWASIACWLGAQLPQVIENYKLSSVEGLALPFLANWLLGDITNLAGCLLTHQLPFQTYLATYFVFIDFTLLSQYYYYTRLRPPPKAYLHPEATSGEREAARYRTLSNVAAHVAATAALAAQREASRSPALSRRQTAEPVDDEPDEDALAALAESFHSEGGRVRRKRVSWSRERLADRAASLGRVRSPVAPLTAAEGDAVVRGRAGREGEEAQEAHAAAQRRNSRAGRRSATIVFLGAWALFGVGTLAGNQGDFARRALGLAGAREGRVLSHSEVVFAAPTAAPAVATVVDTSASAPLSPSPSLPATVTVPPPPTFQAAQEEPSMERVIGRISAWICTTLYLTSRLPQIWKNFVRKSVEGLSILLFVFAFLGNTFYVASILTSPNMSLPLPEASAFLKESLPYLLGSAGTLMFDVTIVGQSVLYRKRKPFRRGRSASTRSAPEEAAGLLGGDALAEGNNV